MSKRLFAFAAAFLAAALPALAQTNPTGTLSGKIVDSQGLAVPGASVTAQSPVLQGLRSAVTSANGDFIIPFLPPGDYEVSVELSGFATTKHTARIAIGQTATAGISSDSRPRDIPPSSATQSQSTSAVRSSQLARRSVLTSGTQPMSP